MLLPEPRLTEHLQKCPHVIIPLTADNPCRSFSPASARNKTKPTLSFCSVQPHFFPRRVLFWPILQSSVAGGHRIQNQVVSLSLLSSVHTLHHPPLFVLPGNICMSMYIFPLKTRASTLLSLTLRHPTQSLSGFLPNEKCIQHSSFLEEVKWGMIMYNNHGMDLLEGSRSIDHFFPR